EVCIPSRDREGAEYSPSKVVGNKHSHGFALTFDDVVNGLLYILVLPQPARASMPRPPFSVWSIASSSVQLAAGVGLKFVQDSLGSDLTLRLHNRVHMVGSHVRRQQAPTAVGTMLPQCGEHGCSALVVKRIGLLKHSSAFRNDAFRIGIQQTTSNQIMVA